MKKLLSILLTLSLVLVMLAGCAPANSSSESASQPAVPTTIRIGGLKGPTSIGLVKVMEDNANGTSANTYEFTVAGTADEITPKFIQGDLDIVAVPANLASMLYNNTNKAVQLLAVNTLGVVYITEKGDSVKSVADLKGKTIYATGKGSTPEYALRYILAQNGIDPDKDVTIEFKSEPTEIVAILNKAESGIAMLPQPYVTVAQGSVEGLHIALDLTEEWNKLDNGSTLITGTVVVRKAFAEEHPDLIAKFLTEYEASTKYVNENVAEAAQLVEKFGLFKAAVAQKAIPYCNIVFWSGDDVKAPMNGYLKTLFDQNPKAIGNAMPDDGFYYEK
ncbi:MAG: ABC transporter substrate-binding protein [Clostridia bacterium]|nr:ABC transporter substrate-binding protein [Clostridia bacterium]